MSIICIDGHLVEKVMIQTLGCAMVCTSSIQYNVTHGVDEFCLFKSIPSFLFHVTACDVKVPERGVEA